LEGVVGWAGGEGEGQAAEVVVALDLRADPGAQQHYEAVTVSSSRTVQQ